MQAGVGNGRQTEAGEGGVLQVRADVGEIDERHGNGASGPEAGRCFAGVLLESFFSDLDSDRNVVADSARLEEWRVEDNN